MGERNLGVKEDFTEKKVLELDQHICRGKTIPGGRKSKGKGLEVRSSVKNDLVGMQPRVWAGVKLESGEIYWR